MIACIGLLFCFIIIVIYHRLGLMLSLNVGVALLPRSSCFHMLPDNNLHYIRFDGLSLECYLCLRPTPLVRERVQFIPFFALTFYHTSYYDT